MDDNLKEVDEDSMSEEYAEIQHICKESNLCKKQYKTKKGLENHITICHKPTLKFICDFCGKEFNRKKYLNKHKVTHNQPAVMCILCDIDLKYPFR